jgi:hypothetical protein
MTVAHHDLSEVGTTAKVFEQNAAIRCTPVSKGVWKFHVEDKGDLTVNVPLIEFSRMDPMSGAEWAQIEEEMRQFCDTRKKAA